MAAPIGNKYAIGNEGGRPALFTDVNKLMESIDEYFENYSPITITGLALHLGFESRQSFYDYEKNEVFSYVIKRARLRVESMYEEKLLGNNCTGPIFALKNMGWTDKTELEHSGNMQLNWHEEKTYEAKPETNAGA